MLSRIPRFTGIALALSLGLGAVALATAPPPAPPVTTGSVSQLGPTVAELTGDLNTGGQVITYQFAYGPTAAYGNTTPPATATPGTNPNAPVAVHSKLSGLSPGATYHYQLMDLTRNLTGGDQTFTTPLTSLAKPSATTLPATAVAQTTATLTGTVNPNGLPTTYKFDYGTTSAYGSRTATQQAGSGTTDVPASAILTSLPVGATYHFRVVATSTAGTTLGGDQTFTTGGAAAGPAAVTGAASAITQNGAAVSGTVDPNGQTTTYYFQYSADTSFSSSTPQVNVGSGISPLAENATITGLTPGTLYNYRLVASSPAGTTIGAGMTFTTAGAAPHGAPTPTPTSGTPTPTQPSAGGSLTLSGLRGVPARFLAVCGKGKRCTTGTRLRFTLSAPARVTILIFGARPVCTGTGPARHCKPGKARKLGSLGIAGHSGPNVLAFSGRVKHHALAPGTYTLIASAQAGSSVSARARLKLIVLA